MNDVVLDTVINVSLNATNLNVQEYTEHAT